MAEVSLKTPITVEEIVEEELYGVLLKSRIEPAALKAEAIKRKLRAAEDFYESDLETKFSPTRVFSGAFDRQNATTQEGKLGLPNDFDRIKDLEHPALDYEPWLWNGYQWGPLTLPFKPLRDISQVVLAYPATTPVFRIPKHWIKPDLRYGSLMLVPATAEASAFPLNRFVGRLIGGGLSIPRALYVDYTCGFTHAELLAHHENLLDGIRKRTLLMLGGIMSTTLTGGQTGGSLSMDGLSRSRSFGGKFGAYSAAIELAIEQEKEVRESWKRQNKGVPMVWT